MEDAPETGEPVDVEDQAAMVATVERQLRLGPGVVSYVDAHSAGQGDSFTISD